MDGIRLVSQAAEFAARHHAAQRRKGEAAEPYVNHLAEVAALLAGCRSPSDAELVAAGWLHDTIEDVGVLPAQIEAMFGPRVRSIVCEVTDDKSLPKPERKLRQEQEAPHKSEDARLLKIADKTSNLRALILSPPATWELARKIEYVTFAQRVVAGCRGLSPWLESQFDEIAEQATRQFQKSV